MTVFNLTNAALLVYHSRVKHRFASSDLETLVTQGVVVSDAVTRAYRKRVQLIKAAKDERDFYALKSLHFEKLKGDRAHQRSMKLNEKYRLILEFEGDGPEKTTVIVGIEDYH